MRPKSLVSARHRSFGAPVIVALLLCAIISLLLPVLPGAKVLFGNDEAFALSLSVVEYGTGAPIRNFWWLVNLDNTNKATPATPNAHLNDNLSVSVAKSYSPVLASGDTNDLSALANLSPSFSYVISVSAPRHRNGTAYVAKGQQSALVALMPYPIPLSQILVQVFHDNHPINAAPDVPAEPGLAGFKVLLYDQLGQMGVDYFGNPLGTTYLRDAEGQYILDVDGNVQIETPGGVALYTDADGLCNIENIAPGKYGIRVSPPTGTEWIQTSTIEGTPGVDAWVRDNEPPEMLEFGFLSAHAWFGFVLPQEFPAIPDPPLPPGQFLGSLTGTIKFARTSRPPAAGAVITAGPPVSFPYLGVNNLNNVDEQVFVGQGAADGTFEIQNIPPGTYQLAIWDRSLDVIIAFRTFAIPPEGGVVDIGDILVPDWFGHLSGTVFYDTNENGVRDAGESGIPGQAVNIRFKDGTIYQSTVTDPNGEYSLNEVFPWFHWTVAEVDFLRHWPTGVSTEADGGGDQPPLDTYSDTDPTLTLAHVVYADQHNKIDWGKREYRAGENGGIAGIVYYDTTRAESDPRLAAPEPWEPGIPNVTINLYRVLGYRANGQPITGPLYRTTKTDSWNSNSPTGCPGDIPTYVDCSETLQTWNQIRPGVFDGGYAFGALTGDQIPAGEYVVEVVTPAGYEVFKEEDKNVLYGNEYGANPLLLPPTCVGDLRVTPNVLSIDLKTEAPFAGDVRRLCTRKLVKLAEGQNAACDFFLFTQVPVPGRLIGLVTGDLVNDPNPSSPRFSDKAGPPFLPVSIQDFAGHEITRTYTDNYGQFEVLLPSTLDINIPQPTGVAPNMVRVITNHPGMPNRPDPYYDPDYKTLELNFDIWPGKTTYADIAIISQSAFPLDNGADCDIFSGVPGILSVDSPSGGPYVPATGVRRLRIRSIGNVTTKGVTKDHGFGDVQGAVTLNGDALPILLWSNDLVVVSVPDGSHTGQLEVTRSNGLKTLEGVTVHVQETGVYDPPVLRVGPTQAYQLIWDAIEAASDGDLILIEPGEYFENLIMYKKVKLQGYGAASTIINGSNFTTINQITQTGGNQAKWVEKFNFLVNNNLVDLVPGNRPNLTLEQGAGVTVLVKDGAFTSDFNGQIDGVTVVGAQRGGGIFVNGYAHYLEISNSIVKQNSGNFGGGIRIGTPSIFVDIDGFDYFSSSFNDNMKIHNSSVVGNGGFDGGGGIAIFNGATDYVIEDCWICGNNTLLYGGGIDHFGLSDGGLIQNNTVIFNSAFDEGGGIMLAGELPAFNGPFALTDGSGTVTVNRNLVSGNMANDDGGGMRLLSINGMDVYNSPDDPTGWHHISIFNNMIANNVSTDAGGGISLGDAVSVDIIHNTIAHNDSTATSIDAFFMGSNVSQPQAAGISDTVLSATLVSVMDPAVQKTFTDPVLIDDIIYSNNSYHWDGTQLVADPAFPDHDLAVFGGVGTELLNPNYCLLTEAYAGGANNIVGNPQFVSEYDNTLTALGLVGQAPDFITVYMQPLTLTGNYHLLGTSDAIGQGTLQLDPLNLLAVDYDGQARPAGPVVDIGADEFYAVEAAPLRTSAANSLWNRLRR